MSEDEETTHEASVDVAERVIVAQEEERARIARELHDETGQWLASLLLQITALLEKAGEPALREQLGQMLCSVTAAIEGVRRITRGLRPRALDEADLATALASCVNDFSRSHGIAVELETPGLVAGGRLPPGVEITVFRVVQEALTNVARHSGAAEVSIVVDRSSRAVRIVVEDDGSGFEPSAAAAGDDSPAGQGLRGLRERISLLKGCLEIESGTAGTTLYVTIPLRAERAEAGGRP
jgi:signal transduction histidine kinase